MRVVKEGVQVRQQTITDHQRPTRVQGNAFPHSRVLVLKDEMTHFMHMYTVNRNETRNTFGTAESPARPQILLCDVEINILTGKHITYSHTVSFNTQYLGDLGFDLSVSLKVKYGAVSLNIFAFLLVFNGNIWPSAAYF